MSTARIASHPGVPVTRTNAGVRMQTKMTTRTARFCLIYCLTISQLSKIER